MKALYKLILFPIILIAVSVAAVHADDAMVPLNQREALNRLMWQGYESLRDDTAFTSGEAILVEPEARKKEFRNFEVYKYLPSAF